MYASCLFCNASFDRNESLEAFPVGKRIAFDAARGRLWVVCQKCERWNLSALDERWEAIEQAERLYRDTRTRAATDNIGLARLRDGTALVRIGAPLRPEFAAWRYGDQFGRRRQRQVLVTGGAVAAFGAVIVGGAVAGIGIASFGWAIGHFGQIILKGNPEAVVTKIHTADGRVLQVRRRHLAETVLSQSERGELAIDLRFKNGADRFEGAEARRIAATIIPTVNRFGGNKKEVATAVEQIERAGTAERFVENLSKRSDTWPRLPAKRSRWSGPPSFSGYGLFALPGAQRLALEMALHEDAERRVLEGELGELERAWKDAEEIAAISDDLLLPDDVRGSFDRLKKDNSA